MKSIAMIIFLLVSSPLWSQSDISLELLPNQDFVCSFYKFVVRAQAGTLEQASFLLKDSARTTWVKGFTPKTVKTTWCLDPTRVDYTLKSPTTTGFYTAGFIIDSSQARSGVTLTVYNMFLTVTNKPTPTDTIIVEARPNELKSILKKIKASFTIVYPQSLCSGYTYDISPPNGLQQHKVFLRDSNSAWVKLNKDTFSLRKGDSIDLKLDFISPTIGQYETYLVTNRGHRGFPLYTLIKFNVKAGTPVNDLTELGINVFPNPTKDKLQITSKNALFTEGVLELTNLLGQVIKRQVITNLSSPSIEVDVSDVLNGVYLLRFSNTKGRQFSTKIVKN
jgi:hypothetical protein